MSVPNVTMARDYGSGGSMGATLERSKLQFVMPTPVQQGPKLDDSGSGGDIGKIIHNGGGGGGDDGDDDDYFADGDDEGDGEGDGSRDSFWRVALPELYDKLSIGCVLAEWFRTVADLPLIIRRAVEMGLFSSAQLVRFCSMDVRPNVTRAVSRSLPPSWARDLVGRLMADPAFVQKMLLEQTFAIGSSLYHEASVRGKNFRKEWDLVLINTLGFAAATAATTWMVAPTRSYGGVHKFPWQQMLADLPQCVFDKSVPLRHYSKQARVTGFVARMAELSAVGALTGVVTSLMSSAAVALRRQRDPEFAPSVPLPSLGRSSAGLGAFFAINANTRYQLLGGLDRYMFDHSNFLWTYIGVSGFARLASNRIGELTRPAAQGVELPQGLRSSSTAATASRRKVRRKKVTSGGRPRTTEAAAAGAATAVLEAIAPVSPSEQAGPSEGASPRSLESYNPISSSPADAANALLQSYSPASTSHPAPELLATTADAGGRLAAAFASS